MQALAFGMAWPSSEELAERAAYRYAYCPADAPAWLGAEPAGPPPAAWMPTANARITVRGTTLLLDAMFKNPPAWRDGEALRGLPASPGVAEGPARVIRGPQDFQRVRPGDVLVARTTNTTFNGILPLLAGLVTDRGGLLAHSAIVAREYGIPGVVGTTDATAVIPDGARIRVDGTAGTVLVLGPAVPEQAAAEAPVAHALLAVPLEGPQVPLALAEAEAERWYGGKAVQLGAALRAGLPVPEGWALPVALVERVAAGDAGAIALVRALPLAGPLAVRSSAVGEDSAEASFAGQHRTVLGAVGADAVVAAVVEVWASTRTDAALAYRRKLGLEASPRCAVVVQPMVAAEVAGVLFSRNPLTGADERVVEAAWGLGEAVVEGLVTPDRFRLTRDGAVLERSPGAKDLAVRLHADGGTAEVPVDPAQAAQLCLDDAKLAALAGLAARCEAVYGGLQDLEWAFAGDRLFLLQRRAMTAVVA
jgi:pyruvate,water dikinase